MKLIPWIPQQVEIPYRYAEKLQRYIFLDEFELSKYPDKDYCDGIYIAIDNLFDVPLFGADEIEITTIDKKKYLRLWKD